MTTGRLSISTVTFEVRIRPPRPSRRPSHPHDGTITVELSDHTCRVWDEVSYTNHHETYVYNPASHPSAAAFFGDHRLINLPHFDALFRYLASQYAANRGNPLGSFLEEPVLAMEREAAQRDGSQVYFAEAAGAVKIGWSKRVATRLAQLQTGCPSPIQLLATISGGKTLEQQLHRRFASLRMAGEWFRAEPELLSYIAEAGS